MRVKPNDFAQAPAPDRAIPLYHRNRAFCRERGADMNRYIRTTSRAVLGLALFGAAVTFSACSDNSAKPDQTNPSSGTAAAAPASGTAGLIAFRRFTDATYSSSQIVTAQLDGSRQKVLT